MSNYKHNIDTIILDMDGVVWRSFAPIGNISWVFQRFQELHLEYALATNNSTRTPEQYVDKLEAIGAKVPPSRIFTSSIAMAHLLKSRYPAGGPVFIVGEEGLTKALSEEGFFHQEENAQAVVVGLDREFSFNKLKQVTYLIRSGLDFYMTNPDRSFPTSKGLGPGAGAIQAAIEAATDVKAILAGKPSPEIIYTVMQKFGSKSENTLVVGDRIETDVMAGQAAGCLTAIVLSGVATIEQAKNWYPRVDYISEDLEQLALELFGK